VQRITSVTRPVTIRDLRCSLPVTAGVHCVTGGVRVSFPGLSKRFTAIFEGLIGVIGRFGRGKADETGSYLVLSAP